MQFWLIIISFFLLSCAKNNETNPVSTPVLVGAGPINETVGEGPIQVNVYSTDVLSTELKAGRFKSVSTLKETNKESLVASFPQEFLGQNYVLGGVITAVSDTTDEDMGSLKLSDLTPYHVRPELRKTATTQALSFLGCDKDCVEGSEEKELFAIPVVAVNNFGDIVLDLSRIGDDFNLFKRIDPDGSGLQLKTQSIRTVAVDSSLSTLIFDNEVTMIPLETPKNGESVKATTFTVRWYLRLTSAFTPAFESRIATEGVGYFMTERVKTPKIQRHALTVANRPTAEGTVHYFIKNVPAIYQRSFASAFDEWNDVFVATTGKKVLSYEFVSADDKRNAQLVAGDPRYHIMEWDLVNAAGYGGLGPSQAHQFSGEIFGSNVLIQGPKIIKIYTEWFQSATAVKELRDAGLSNEADILEKQAAQKIGEAMAPSPKGKLAVNADGKSFVIHSQNPPLQDPIMQREDFDIVPANYSFERYMDGYFHDMVAHELGHNLGLRHNFKGNLFSELPLAEGKVSISVMEYLGRGFRYLDKVGNYDVMAIKYGYLGTTPEIKNRFCTDEDVPRMDAPTLSAECSRDDATPDPFTFLTNRLIRASELLLAKGSAKAPTWTLDDMKREVSAVLPAIGFYVTSAPAASLQWQVFFSGGDRPTTGEGVPSYVLGKLKSILCPADFEAILAAKESDEARAKTKANRDALVARALEVLKPLKIISETELCH